MPDFFKKAPKQLRLENTEGVEVKRKFATSRVLKWGLIIYCFFIFRSCLDNSMYQKQQQQGNNNNKPSQTIEQVLPSSLKHYDASKLSFKKSMLGGEEAYSNGGLLGFVGETYVLTNKEGGVTGYLNSSGLFNTLGQYSGNIYKGEVFDLYGNKIGSLKGKGNDLESIVNNDKEIMKVNGNSYVIMAKTPSGQGYSLIGILDDYKEKAK